jgi:hypothetical protein
MSVKREPMTAEGLDEVVRRSLLEAGEMMEIEERAREASERAALRTPVPEKPSPRMQTEDVPVAWRS